MQVNIKLNQDTPAGTYTASDVEGSLTLTVASPPPVSTPPPGGVPPPVSSPPASAAFTLQVMGADQSAPPAVIKGTVGNGVAVDVTVQAGQRVPLVRNPDGSYAFQYGAATYYPDGCVVLENSYAGADNPTPADVVANLSVQVGTRTFQTGAITLWYLSWTRPFWAVAPQPGTLDTRYLPAYGTGSDKASFAASYAHADNSILGIGMAARAIGNVGERPDLGIIPGWDAAYITNPNADNLVVVRGMADASAPWPFHAIDTATNVMLIAGDYPKTSLLQPFLSITGNPFHKYTTTCPYLLGQATGHAVGFNVLACALYGTDYDRASLSQWANYVGRTWGNYSYALSVDGPISMRHVEGCRGVGRTLKTIVQAARLGETQHAAMFSQWGDQVATELKAWLAGETGLQITRPGPGYPGGGYAPWGMHIATAGVGYAIQCGFVQFQSVLDQYAIPILDSLLVTQHELATVYASGYENADRSLVATWLESLQREGELAPNIAEALKYPEGSVELQSAYAKLPLGQLPPGTVAGDFVGYPESPDGTGYPAMMQPAVAYLADYATDARAKAAWTKFAQYCRQNYATDPKYNIVPHAA